MSERKIEIQVGILFVVAVTALVLGVLWFKSERLRAMNQEVTVAFPKTSGLIRGDPVEVRGVSSGNVKNIRYEDGRALVTLDLDRKVKLHANSAYVIENVGIMGQKMIAIYPGDGPPIDPKDKVLEGIYQPGVTEMMADVSKTVAAFDRMATRLDQVMSSFDTQGGSLGRTLKNSEQVSSEMATFMRDSRGDLTASIRSMRLAMDDLHQALEGREDNIGRIIERTERASVRLDSTLATFDATAQRLNRMLVHVEQGQGTLGRAFYDDALYEDLVSTLHETQSLVADIRANPKKYVKLSLF